MNQASPIATERLHHPYSPSKLQYLEVSPRYTGEQSTNTEASEAGTLQHDAAEAHVDIDDPRLEDHQAEAVAMCKAYREAIVARYPGGSVIKEQYLPVDGAVIADRAGNKFQGTTGGYLDLAVISADKKTAEIVDWKFGMWSVEPAENNLQGIAYLLGLYYAIPSLEEVTVHFCMPHRDEIDVHTFKRSQFPALLLRVKTVVARAQAAAECTATVSSCLFCGNKGTCPVLAAFALKVGKKYSPVVVPENLTPSLFTDPASSTKSMEVAQLLEAWAKAIRAQITAKTIEDENWMPTGYKLRSRADNTVVSWEAVIEAARKRGVPEAALKEAQTVRMTPINKAVSEASPRGEKKAAQEAFRDELLAAGHLVKEQPIYFLERLKT